jgi:hypothetical protein
MPLSQDEIAVISRDVVRSFPRALDLIGVTASDGGSNRVEIMVTVKGCHDQPCRLLLNLSRGDRKSLESELRRKLQDQLRTHSPTV